MEGLNADATAAAERATAAAIAAIGVEMCLTLEQLQPLQRTLLPVMRVYIAEFLFSYYVVGYSAFNPLDII
jgi:hypothetical protein